MEGEWAVQAQEGRASYQVRPGHIQEGAASEGGAAIDG